MAKNHLGFAEAAAARSLHIIRAKTAVEVEPQGIGEHAAQQQPQRAGRQNQVANRALQCAPVPLEHAVGNQKAAALWRHHSWREASADR